MSASEAGTATGTVMLYAIVVTIAVIMGISLYRRLKYPKDKHLNAIAYWVLFILGLLFIFGQIISILQSI